MAMTSSEPPETIVQIVRTLVQEFGDSLANETIEETVRETQHEFEGARIPTFVPLFVERYARQRLKASARTHAGMVPRVAIHQSPGSTRRIASLR